MKFYRRLICAELIQPYTFKKKFLSIDAKLLYIFPLGYICILATIVLYSGAIDRLAPRSFIINQDPHRRQRRRRCIRWQFSAHNSRRGRDWWMSSGSSAGDFELDCLMLLAACSLADCLFTGIYLYACASSRCIARVLMLLLLLLGKRRGRRYYLYIYVVSMDIYSRGFIGRREAMVCCSRYYNERRDPFDIYVAPHLCVCVIDGVETHLKQKAKGFIN